LKSQHSRHEHRWKRFHKVVEIADTAVEVASGELKLVLDLGQLLAELAKIRVGLERGISLRDGQQLAQAERELGFRDTGLPHRLSGRQRGASLPYVFQNRAFVVTVGLHAGDEARHQVVASLELHVDPAPRFFQEISLCDETVERPRAPRERHDAERKKQPEEMHRHMLVNAEARFNPASVAKEGGASPRERSDNVLCARHIRRFARRVSAVLNVYVTGANRGLGRALCLEFAARGHRVFAGLFPDATPRLSEESPRHERIVPVPLDVCRDDSVAAAAETIRAHTATLDVLVNNAGRLGVIEGTIEQLVDCDDILLTLNTNAVGPLRVTRSVLDLLQRGTTRSIVNISSEAGCIGDAWREGWFGYGMSKAALNMQTVLCFNRLRSQGFKVRLVHPGWLRTFMRGACDVQADFEPEEVVADICNLALADMPEPRDRVPFTDQHGMTLPW
jgi:NAD(P)-dependent dehydrogenase (short-subunit alcohol dehydrogenase family)